MNHIRRFLSVLLALSLVFGLLPVTAMAANYDMFITNVRVSDANRADILGDGVFCFDGDHTLTVRGSCEYEDLPIISSAVPDLIIRVIGNCRLHSDEAPVILSNAGVILTGPGTLELQSGGSCGIYVVGCGVTVRNISLYASGVWGIAGDKPDDENEFLHICNADIDAAGSRGAVCDFGGGIVLEDCDLEYGGVGAFAIEDAEHKAAETVSILHTGSNQAPELHTVTFLNDRGDAPAPQTVEDGTPAKEPRGMASQDFLFTGWYADPECQESFDFSAPITSDLNLYAGWEYAPDARPHTVIFLNFLGAEPLPQTVSYGALASDPGVLTAKDYIFTGWCIDPEGLLPFDFSTPITEERLLYAGWEYAPGGPDLGDLQEAIAAAEQVDTDLYTCESVIALAKALIAARDAMDSGDPSVVDAAANALTDALAALEAKPEDPPVPVDPTDPEIPSETGDDPGKEDPADPEIPSDPGDDPAPEEKPAGETDPEEKTESGDDPEPGKKPAEQEKINPFADVSKGSYCYDSVLWACFHEPQITNGVDKTHFSPDRTCTRGQIVTFLWRANGCPSPASTVNPFEDVKAGAFYCKAVLWAVEQGITKGMDATHFGPDLGCTRGHVATFLWRAEHEPKSASTENPFLDIAPEKYYCNAVLWAVNHKPQITNGTDLTHFSPDAECTRGQIVTFLYRAMGS